MEKINILYFLLGVVALAAVYWLLHRRKHCRVMPRTEDIPFSRLNGIGTCLTGGYRTDIAGRKVYYVIVSILFIPFIPLECIVASKGKTGLPDDLPGFPGIKTDISVYGKSKWNLLELLAIYAFRWGILIFLIILL